MNKNKISHARSAVHQALKVVAWLPFVTPDDPNELWTYEEIQKDIKEGKKWVVPKGRGSAYGDYPKAYISPHFSLYEFSVLDRKYHWERFLTEEELTKEGVVVPKDKSKK